MRSCRSHAISAEEINFANACIRDALSFELVQIFGVQRSPPHENCAMRALQSAMTSAVIVSKAGGSSSDVGSAMV